MTHTFLVALNLDDTSDLQGIATDLAEDIGQAGWEVNDVKPWSPHDTIQLAQTLSIPAQPPVGGTPPTLT